MWNPFFIPKKEKSYPFGIDDLILVNGEYQKVELQDYHDPDYYEKLKEKNDNRKANHLHQDQ